jgi:hypothetical protein
VNRQAAMSMRGAGPFDNTGKSSVSNWPGGKRLAKAAVGRRPVNPRVTMSMTSGVGLN